MSIRPKVPAFASLFCQTSAEFPSLCGCASSQY